MKASTVIVLLMAAVAAGAAFVLTRSDPPVPFALDREITLLRGPGAVPVAVVFAVDRIPADDQTDVETQGFLEGVEYQRTTGTLKLAGWTPLDLQADTGRLIVRDPFGASVPGGSVELTAIERPDVRRALGDSSSSSRYGFTLDIPLREAGSGSGWLQSFEVYADDGGAILFALKSGVGRASRTWTQSPEAFELAVVFATPAYAEDARDGGHLDLVEAGAEEGTVRLHGWAPFDARSPGSLLCVRLPRSLAPASIVARQPQLRPDVPPVVDPNRPELQYGGFIVTLAISGSLEDLKKEGALALWTIKDDEAPVSVHIGKLK